MEAYNTLITVGMDDLYIFTMDSIRLNIIQVKPGCSQVLITLSLKAQRNPATVLDLVQVLDSLGPVNQ